jgi:CubicO group peptidase (beta-lactamase class C family)
MSTSQFRKIRSSLAVIVATALSVATPVTAQFTDPMSREHSAAMAAHHLCAGMYVVGRSYQRPVEQVLKQDVLPFAWFNWQTDFEYRVDDATKTATVSAPGITAQSAQYHGDQGCTILPPDAKIHFTPVSVARNIPNPATTPWPTGDVGAHATFPGVDQTALGSALDWAMTQPQNTRAFVVVYHGKIIGERYAPGFTAHTPQISWSQGKSITAALIGVLVQQGELQLTGPAPVAEWHRPGDPRNRIEIRNLMHMGSGLDFLNLGLDQPNSWHNDNEHFRVYFDAINVFEHAINQPVDLPPDSLFRYRNSDPLTLGRIVRQKVEARGENYLTFPQRALFDKIGARNYVLEPDAWGNFIMTGYDFGSAWDWARFGLLHLWDGVWNGERILPEGWVDFISTPAPGAAERNYGGLFWLNRGGTFDRIPEDAYYAAGFMGQTTMVIPSRDMVIVRLGPSPGGFNPYFNEAVGRVLAAIGKPSE